MEQKNTTTPFPSWDELNQLFNGSLSETESLELIERIQTNSSEDESEIGIKNWLEKNNYQLHLLKQWVNSSQKQIKQSPSPRIPLLLKAAATIAILLTTTYFLYQFVSIRKGNWENYYTHDPGFPILMGKSSQGSLWMEIYRSGNAANALTEIHTAQVNNPINDTLLYYEAVVLFENNNAQASLIRLQKIDGAKSNYNEDIEFLRAFCYWQLDDLLKAKKLFEQIAQQKIGKHSLKAQEILTSEFSKH
jgi:hypothetical protein